jgi:NAD(P)-dependent dehydrogenase (short-subunit alcohol dehydrogenase family)
MERPVALVTGAGRSNGIGAAIAHRLARDGFDLVVADLCAPPSEMAHSGHASQEELAAVAAGLSALGGQALPLRVDVADGASVQAMVAATRDTYGRLDVLVNNAGAAIGPGPVIAMQEAAWRRTLEINATGTFLVCKYALPLLLATASNNEPPGARIVNVASIAAVRPKPMTAAYAASKAAVVALTQSLAQEVAAAGITVNAVLPGDVDTGMKQWQLQLEAAFRRSDVAETTAAAVARIPLGRLATPADVAALVSFLAGPGAAFITGQAYNLTGGRELT